MKWCDTAASFTEECHSRLLRTPAPLQVLFSRGLTQKTIESFHLGWNAADVWDNRSAWGLSTEVDERGRIKPLWLPQGLVIPFLPKGLPIALKIRRSAWHPADRLPKYAQISGSIKRPAVYGDPSNPIVVVESEFDAILIQQFAVDLCCCVALGGVSKRPDRHTDELLRSSPIVLLSLDYDEGAAPHYKFWLSHYSNVKIWPAGQGKSPGDSFQFHGIDLRQWVLNGLAK